MIKIFSAIVFFLIFIGGSTYFFAPYQVEPILTNNDMQIMSQLEYEQFAELENLRFQLNQCKMLHRGY